MSVIIGGGTLVTSPQFSSAGIVSINFSFQPTIQRLYQLGSFAPFDTFVQSTRTMQVGVYGGSSGTGGSSTLDVSPSTTCVNTASTSISVTPASCDASLTPFSDEYFLTSYSYQKQNLGYGQESWSFTSRPILPNYTGNIIMVRNSLAEGTMTVGPGTMNSVDMGVIIDNAASNDSLGNPIQGGSGSVQAGGIGNYDTQRNIVATTVGGSVGKSPTVDGLTGNINISSAVTPVFL